MRNRYRTIVHSQHIEPSYTNVPNIWYKCDGTTETSTFASLAGWTQITDQVFERIADETGIGKPHGVIHRKRRNTVSTAVAEYGNVQNVSPYGWHSNPGINNRWILFHQWCVDRIDDWDVNHDTSVPPYWTIDMSHLNEVSLKEAILENARQLKADVLLNIVEANQIWPSIKSLAGCLPEMGANWRRLRKVIKTASGSYLAWKFGVSPILSDIMAIDRYLPRLKSDMERHQDGKTSRFSVKAELPCYFDDTVHYEYANSKPYLTVTRQGLLNKRPVVRYVLVVKPTIKYETSLFSAMDHAMRRFASSPASLAWEKVPFSFVVDWFVDLRGVARAIDKAVGFEPYKIVSFTRSLNYNMSTNTFMKINNSCESNEVKYDKKAGSVEFSHYERSLVSDKASLPYWKPRFGKNQASVSAALIAQQLAKLR